MGQLIGSYGYCNKHGPYGGTRCTLCDKEHAETLQMIWDATMPQFVGIDWGKGKSWTGATTIMTAPTQQQLNDPKWWDENAPKGATHAIFRDFPRWLMLDHGIWRFWEGGWWSRPSAKPAGEILARPTKPPAPEWNGEGLPPVGRECEGDADTRPGGYEKCLVVYHDECAEALEHSTLALFRQKGSQKFTDPEWCSDFRPLRTKEQRERDETIAAAIRACPYPGSETTKVDIEALYDAGMLRKAGDK